MSVRSPQPDPASGGGRGPVPDPLGELSAEALIRRERPAPKGGWRRALYTVTGGRFNPGESKTERRRQELEASVGRAVLPEEHQSIVVLGADPGVGATTVALGLGSVLAAHRGDRIIAVDAEAEHAPLTERLPLKWHAELPLQDLIASKEAAVRFSDMNRFTAQTTGGLDVLASRPEDTASRPLGLEGFRRISDSVERHYPVQLVDAGSGLGQPAMPAVLARATRLVLVCAPTKEGAGRAATVLDELRDLGFDELAAGCTIVVDRAGTGPGVEDLRRQLADRCAGALLLPEDPQLSAGRPVELGGVRAATALGLLELAVEITEGFGRARGGAGGRPEGA